MWYFDLNPDGVKALTGIDVNTSTRITVPDNWVETASLDLFNFKSFDFVKLPYTSASDIFRAVCHIIVPQTNTTLMIRSKRGKPYLKSFVSIKTVKVSIAVRVKPNGFVVRINDALYYQQWYGRRLSIRAETPEDLVRSVILVFVGMARKARPDLFRLKVESQKSSVLNR